MQMISHPVRLDASGAVVTIDDGSDRAACELAGHVISCWQGERPLAPTYGLAEPDPDQVAGVVAWCEPEVVVASATVDGAGPGAVDIRVEVDWSQS